MSGSNKVAVVTGSNKGIGFAIVRGLCEKFDGKVYLTSRDVTRGKDAVKKLNALGLHPLFHQLDISDIESINKFKDHLVNEHKGLDVLVNNAAVGFGYAGNTSKSFREYAEETIDINYFGVIKVTSSLSPLLRENGRIINVSSDDGCLTWIQSDTLRKKISNKSLTLPELNGLMDKFVSDAKSGQHIKEGWGDDSRYTDYAVSKIGLNALTEIQQRDFDKETPCRNISVNSVHPGYVATDINQHTGHLTVEEGAIAPLYLALENHGLKGQYVWYNKKVSNWRQ